MFTCYFLLVTCCFSPQYNIFFTMMFSVAVAVALERFFCTRERASNLFCPSNDSRSADASISRRDVDIGGYCIWPMSWLATRTVYSNTYFKIFQGRTLLASNRPGVLLCRSPVPTRVLTLLEILSPPPLLRVRRPTRKTKERTQLV